MTRNWLLMELRPYVSMLSLPYSALGPLYLSNKKTKKKHLVYWKVVHVKTASDSVWRNAFSVFQVRSIYLDLLSRPPVLAKEKDVTNFPSRDALWSAKGEKSSIASVCAWNAGQQHLENCEDYKVQWKLYPQLDIIGYLMLCFFSRESVLQDFPWLTHEVSSVSGVSVGEGRPDSLWKTSKAKAVELRNLHWHYPILPFQSS